MAFSRPVSLGAVNADWVEHDGWYRPDSTRFLAHRRDRSIETTVEEVTRHVLDGWLPPAPFITRDMLITAFGSCFAYRVETVLRAAGYTTSLGRYGQPADDHEANYWSKSLLIKCGEGFVNTFSIRYQLEWMLAGTQPDVRIWHKSEGRIRQYIDSNDEAGRRLIGETDVFIMTLGLSEVWYSKETGKVLWTAVPREEWDPDRFGFRLTTVQENLDNLSRIVDLLHEHRPDAPIVFTLSPVPLNATFRPVSCISANSVSKAILRVAIDELMRQRAGDPKLFYFPSYDMVTGYFPDPFGPDGSHVRPEIIQAIMASFMRHYCL